LGPARFEDRRDLRPTRLHHGCLACVEATMIIRGAPACDEIISLFLCTGCVHSLQQAPPIVSATSPFTIFLAIPGVARFAATLPRHQPPDHMKPYPRQN
jgi:hypothetical protein